MHSPVLPWPSVCPPNGWQVPLLLWHASRLRLAGASARQLGSAYGSSDSGERNSPGLNAQPGAPARAGASHGADKASECSPRLAQMRPSSQPTVHRLLKKHCDECGTGDAWQAGDDAVIGCWCAVRVTLCVSAIVRAVHQSSSKLCLLYTSPSPRDATLSRMPSSA